MKPIQNKNEIQFKKDNYCRLINKAEEKMNKFKNKIILQMLIIVCMFGLTSCSQRPFNMKMPPMPVESSVLNLTDIFDSDVYQGNLISRYSVNLQPQVVGQVAKIYVNPGDKVKAGQLLMLIDNRKQESALNSAKATTESAKATLYNLKVQRKTLESNLEYNKQMYERYKALYAKKTVSKQDLDKYTDTYNKAKYDLEANDAQMKAQIAEIDKSNYLVKEQKVQLQFYKITAPYSGIIGDIPAKVGDSVNIATNLLNITQNDKLELNISLPSDKVFDIKKGLSVEILDNLNNIVVKSKISFVSPVIDKETQTILVKALIPNPNGILKADQSVKARVIYDTQKGIVIPTSSVTHLGGQDFVYIVQNLKNKYSVKQQPVKLGKIFENKYVVLNGLSQGDQVVTQGIQKLMDGAAVTINGKGN